MCCKMVWKFCEIWKLLWEFASSWARFCEISSHSVRYGMYANQITWSMLLIQIHILIYKQCSSRSVGFFRSQLIWIYTVCKGRIYLGSAGLGFRLTNPTLYRERCLQGYILFFLFLLSRGVRLLIRTASWDGWF